MKVQPSIYEAVSSSRRRAACRYVAATNADVVTLEEIATHIVTDEYGEGDHSVVESESYSRVLIELHHTHLPKLADHAVLEYDVEQNLVREGADLPTAIDLIEAAAHPTVDTGSSA